jgi:hypothetical protein
MSSDIITNLNDSLTKKADRIKAFDDFKKTYLTTSKVESIKKTHSDNMTAT